MNKLLTKTQRTKLIKNHKDQDGTKEFNVVVKLFNPTGAGTWYLTELDEETNTAFGVCKITDAEVGYISMTELEDFRGRMGLKIERDMYSDLSGLTLEGALEK